MNDLSYNKGAIEVAFLLPDINYIIYLPIEGTSHETFSSVTGKLSAEIQRIFGKPINPKDIILVLK